MRPVYAVFIQQVFTPANKFSTFGELVTIILKNALVIAGLVFLVLLILGGVGVIVGAGSADTKKLEQGKQAVTGAVIGLLVIVGAVWIVQILERITGVLLLGAPAGGPGR